MYLPILLISDFVLPGKNTIRIEISTPLGNRMIADGRYIPGMIGLYSNRVIDYQDYGLTKFYLIPYQKESDPKAQIL